MKEKHYTEIVDEAVGFTMYTHRTLRTCLDPASHEWTETNMQKKVDILKKVLVKGNDLQDIILEYKRFYKDMNKSHVGEHVEDGLIELIQHLLTDQGGG
jgi:hypothetical protein